MPAGGVMKVKLLDLVPQYETIRLEVEAAMDGLISGQQFILGPAVRKLEAEIAEYCGTRFAVGVASGSDAILLSLMALGVGEGDEVVTTPYTFFSTVSSITRLGARPVFVDIDPITYNIEPEGVLRAFTERSKAVIPVHLFGQSADMDPICAAAGERGVAVVEDACQAIGALYRERRVGSIGVAGCFSFFPSKNLGGFGDGGMVTTDDEELAKRLESLRVHGSREKYYHDFVGLNSRLDALQAVVLSVKLGHLDVWNEQRRRNAGYYSERLGGIAGISVPLEAGYNKSVFNQYVIRAERRDDLMRRLREKGIGCEVYYPLPLHMQSCFAYVGASEGDFPVAERAARETLALPVYPELPIEQMDYVVEVIAGFAEKG
jgi:dTDP-4-amino-4,6-dideoxygalactose transaminase